MRPIEYRHLVLDIADLSAPTFDGDLRALGEQGWDLRATVTHDKHGYSKTVHFIFTRPRPDEPAAAP